LANVVLFKHKVFVHISQQFLSFHGGLNTLSSGLIIIVCLLVVKNLKFIFRYNFVSVWFEFENSEHVTLEEYHKMQHFDVATVL